MSTFPYSCLDNKCIEMYILILKRKVLKCDANFDFNFLLCIAFFVTFAYGL